MDVDLSGIDPLAGTGSTTAQPMGVLFADQPNPFGNATNNGPMEWDFGKPSFGNGVPQ